MKSITTPLMGSEGRRMARNGGGWSGREGDGLADGRIDRQGEGWVGRKEDAIGRKEYGSAGRRMG